MRSSRTRDVRAVEVEVEDEPTRANPNGAERSRVEPWGNEGKRRRPRRSVVSVPSGSPRKYVHSIGGGRSSVVRRCTDESYDSNMAKCVMGSMRRSAV